METTLLTRVSEFTGKEHTMELPGTAERYEQWLLADCMTRPHVQHAFPDLSPEQREFLLTGITQEEWDAMMGEEDPDFEPPFSDDAFPR
jgi:hypothetical protein